MAEFAILADLKISADLKIKAGREIRSVPLTAAQRGIWYAQAAAPGGNAFWIAEYLDIAGPIDPAALEAALRDVLAEADGLHAAFRSSPAGAVQHPGSLSPEWRLLHLDFSDRDQPLQAADDWMQRDVRTPGALADPLFSHALIKLSPHRFLFYHRYHHIVTDGFTGVLIASRLAALYSRLIDPGASVGHGVRTFGRFATVLAADLAYQGSAAQEADGQFWRAAMAGWEGPARLAGGVSAIAAEQSLVRPLAVESALSERLTAGAAAQGVSFADFLSALVAIWVNVMTGVEDLALGLAMIARTPGSSTARVPTVATNVLPVRLTLRAGMTVADLAQEARSFRRAARRHSRYRGERLIAELTQGRATSFGPTLNMMSFSYHPAFGGHPSVVHNVSIGPVADLCVTVYDRQDSGPVEMTLNANPALYRPEQLETLAARFERLLRIAAEDPQRTLGKIDLLGPEERVRLERTRNPTQRDIPPSSLASLFDAQVAASPDAPCLVENGTELTYAAAGRAADRLFAHLIAHGVARGDIIGIMLPRSAETIIAIVAVARTGAAFLLLDPALPAARIAAMTEEARPVLLLTRQTFAALAPPGVKALFLRESTANETAPAAPPAPAVDPEALAYVIFTSGTTGRPKPIGIPNRGLGSLALALTERLGTDRDSRVLQFSALGFDALVLELCLAFAVGASVHLPREEERYGPPLGRFLDRHEITHALIPPTALSGLTAEAQTYPKVLIVGGEACSAAVAEAWSTGRSMVNAYGPAEYTVCATLSDPLSGSETPPIGRPIVNARLYVLDGFGRLAPDGGVGELHIAGAGLGLGYLGRPELTAERFIACPFERGPFEPEGVGMYRTGDLVRWRPDGTLAYHGRADRQIKLRGFRIEPGEIETALCRLPDIRAAQIVTVGEGAHRALAAYAVPAAGRSPDAATLRRALNETLPSYMVPASITILPALPLTPNGKVDLAALPPPEIAPSGGTIPETATEKALAPLFAASLGRDDVGVEDNFFAMGGDSLKATLLILWIGETLSIELTIAALFAAPTVRALAALLDEDPEILPPTACLLPLSDGVGPGLFCIHPGPGLGWPYAVLIRHLSAGQPIYAVQARGLDGEEELPASLEAMAADYAAEIRRHQPHGPYHLLGWSSGGPLAHAVATALQAEGCEIGLLASLDGYPASPLYHAATPQGHDPDAERGMLRGTIARFLAAADPHQAPPAPVMNDALLTAMLAIFSNTGRLLSQHRLGVFEGDLLLFKSTEAYDVPLPGPESWTAHVTGRVDLVEVACHHDSMLLPGPIETIGPIIAERLLSRNIEAANKIAPHVTPPEASLTVEPQPAMPQEGAHRLSILMTNVVLAARSGTEMMTAELARALLARGHRVAVYTPEPGPLARELMARGIPVTNRIDRIGFTPDIIHGHHNAPTAVAMIRFPQTPALLVCHDSSYSFDDPVVADRVAAYVAIDGACVDRLVVAGVDEARITAIPNGIDLSRFQLREAWSERPRTALAIVKGDAPHLPRLREACAQEGLPLEVVGHNVGRVVDNLPEFCAAADIVLAHSRSAMEAAATGAAVVICDEYGFGGLLTPEQIERWPDTRLAHRSLDDPLSVDAVRAAIRAYDRDAAERAARLLRARVSWEQVSGQYEQLYRKAVADWRNTAIKPDDGRLAAFVAELLPKRHGHSGLTKQQEAAEQRRRDLDEWLTLYAPTEGADTEIRFNVDALGRHLLSSGWYAAEDWCVWSGDTPAVLRLPAALLARSDGELVVQCATYFSHLGPEDELRHVEVLARGRVLMRWEFDRPTCQHNQIVKRALSIPPSMARAGGSLEIAFRTLETRSPFEVGDGEDTRQLGFALVSISPRSL